MSTLAAASPIQWGKLGRVSMVAFPITLLFLIAPSALIIFGFNYVSPGGTPFDKIHPGTVISVIVIAIMAVTGRSQKLRDVLFLSPALIYYLIFLMILAAYGTVLLSVPIMSLVDTFLMPAFCVLMIGALTFDEKRLLSRFFDVLMLLNSMLGIFESLKNWRLVPLTQYSAILGQFVYPHEYRSTAFLGHPLTNSYVTGSYMLALILTRRIQNSFVKYSLLGVHFVGLFAFGSRGASVFLLIFAIIYIIYSALSTLGTSKISKDVLIYLGGGIPAVSALAIVVLTSGFADRFLERFVNDKGSAEARSLGLEMVTSFPLGSLVLGPPIDLTYQVMKRYGVIAIENFWLAFIVTYGILGCFIFFPALFEFCRKIGKMSTPVSYVILFYFFLCCTTSASLAAKNYSLGFVTIICLTSLDFSRGGRTGSGRPHLAPSRSLPIAPLPIPVHPVVAARRALMPRRS